MATASLYDYCVVRKFIDEPVLAVYPPAELAILVLESLRLALSLQRSLAANAFEQAVYLLEGFLVLTLPVQVCAKPVSVNVILLILPPWPQALPSSSRQPVPP